MRPGSNPFIKLFVLFALLTFVNLCTAQTVSQTAKQETITLESNKSIERTLKGGETHSYKITLKTGEYFHVDVEQRGIDVLLSLVGTDGKVIIERDRPNGTQGAESLSFIATTAGDYRFDVKVLNEKVEAGKYEIKSDAPRTPTTRDRKQIEAETLTQKALQLSQSGTKESVTEACLIYEAAALLWRELGEKYEDALMLISLGDFNYYLGRVWKALDYYNQALPLMKVVSDKSGEARALYKIGSVVGDLGDRQNALIYLNQALYLKKIIGDKSGEAETLHLIGESYYYLGELGKALDYYNQALPLKKAAGYKSSEMLTLINIGNIYYSLGELQKALDYFNQALILSKEVKGQSKAIILNNIGQAYEKLGIYQKALDSYNQALSLTKVLGVKAIETRILSNIGSVYHKLRELQKALEYYNQALSSIKDIGDKTAEITTLGRIGSIYYSLNELQKALDYFNHALILSKEVGYKAGEGIILNSIGLVYDSLNEYQKALDSYNQALILSKHIGDKKGEATILNNIMFVWYQLKNPRLAVFYGKQSVNAYQQLRINIKGLDKELQNTFLKTVEGAYHYLADMLIEQGRIPEAQAVLDLLKDEEFSSTVRRSGNAGDAVPYSKVEAKVVEVMKKIAEIAREYDELSAKGKNGLLDDAGKARLKQLDADVVIANNEYQKALKELETVAQTSDGYQAAVKEADALMADLSELGAGTVALYTVIVKDEKGLTKNGWVMLITPSFQKAYPIDVTDLEQTIFAFRAALSNPAYDPQPLAERLYKMLFLQTSEKQKTTLAEDLDAYLKNQKDKTLMWSLDGVLRYVPIAALHDGKQYLVEKYRNTVFNTASKARLKDNMNKTWTALGLGVTEERKEAGLTFSALPGSEKELKRIIKEKDSPSGILQGIVIKDKNFTQDAMLDGIRFNNNSVIHISSHFSFHTADFEQSFLLLGQGYMTVKKMRENKNLLRQVDLVTLSACDTAMGNANGKDAEGFAYEVQSLGAKSVIASLWPVDDIGTQVLMPEFYRLHETGLSKIEAMRKAQLSLLNGEIKDVNTEGVNRAKIVGVTDNKYNLKPYKKDPAKPFAHPYYWAPFILIGNWK